MEFALAGLNLIGGLFSTFAAGRQAKANNRAAIAELQSAWQQVGVQNEQLLEETKSVGRAAEYQATQRIQQALKTKTQNAAWMSASGNMFNASQAVAAKETDRKTKNDLGTLSYNTALQKKRIADQIKVNRMSLDMAAKKAAMTISQGTANTIGVATNAAIDFAGSLIKSFPGGMST